MKVIDCSREVAKTPDAEGAAEQSTGAVAKADASARDADRSTLAIVFNAALSAVIFYVVAHLIYLYVDQWSDLDVEVIGLPSFEELDRSVSAQRIQWSTNSPIVDSPWRQVYMAASFSDAIRIVEQGNACGTPDAQAFISRAKAVCEYMEPHRPKYSEERASSLGGSDSRPASWSVLLSMYFQDRYCLGYEIGAEQQCHDAGGPVHDRFRSAEDEALFDSASRSYGTFHSLYETSRSGRLYAEIADQTISPELYHRSVIHVYYFERAGIVEENHLTGLMGLDDIDGSKQAASTVAMCDIYGVCPPLGLVVMSECMPDRCPVDGEIRTFFRQINSPEVVELTDLWSEELISRREALVRGRLGSR